MSGSGREVIPDVWEWSRAPPRCLAVVSSPSRMFGRASRMSRIGRGALPDVREGLPDVRDWSGCSPGCPGVVGRPSRMSGSTREAVQNVQE